LKNEGEWLTLDGSEGWFTADKLPAVTPPCNSRTAYDHA